MNKNSKEPKYFFWLGEEGDLELIDNEETFKKRQRDWKGPRPNAQD